MRACSVASGCQQQLSNSRRVMVTSSTPGRLCSCVHVTRTCWRQHTQPLANLYRRHMCLRGTKGLSAGRRPPQAKDHPQRRHRGPPHSTGRATLCSACCSSSTASHTQWCQQQQAVAPRHSGAPPTCHMSSHRQARQPPPALHACCSIRSLVLLQHVGSQPRTHKHTVTVSHNQSLHATPEASLARKTPSPSKSCCPKPLHRDTDGLSCCDSAPHQQCHCNCCEHPLATG